MVCHRFDLVTLAKKTINDSSKARDCTPAIPGFPSPGNFPIPGLSRTQSRDFGINKIYLFNGLLVLLKVILCIYSFFDAFLSPQ